ncbi:MAG: Fic family protein, partial [Candidatus Roizmanbacteria bacterium]|nr:Fic family protein [Candidatus Roizmanbacteria bacterium]
MKIPNITITPAIHTLLLDIEILITSLSNQLLPIHVSHSIDEQSILKSSLYSARIEGNPLSEESLEHSDSTAKREIFNVVDAVRYIRALPEKQPLTLEEIKRIHSIIMKNLTSDAGRFRTEQNAIFYTAGNIRYLPPPPIQMRKDIARLITYANT